MLAVEQSVVIPQEQWSTLRSCFDLKNSLILFKTVAQTHN